MHVRQTYKQVRVNLVEPGYITTDMTAAISADEARRTALQVSCVSVSVSACSNRPTLRPKPMSPYPLYPNLKPKP